MGRDLVDGRLRQDGPGATLAGQPEALGGRLSDDGCDRAASSGAGTVAWIRGDAEATAPSHPGGRGAVDLVDEAAATCR
jgi:hypothetical protein